MGYDGEVSLKAARIWTGATVCVVVAGFVFNLLGGPPEGALPEKHAPVDTGQVRVASVVGVVEVRRDDGEWVRLEPGRELSEGDEVRTADFSQAILRPKQGATLTLTPNTTFTIGDETPEVSRFTLGVGRVSADVERRRERTFEFDSATGGARADTRGGEFHLVADGEGLLGVVTQRGEVGLSAEGERVVVPAGRQAVAMPGRAPSQPLPIPQEVFLQVEWPEERTEEERVKVAGQTDVGARVRLGERRVTVGHDGTFEVEVPLSEGENRLVVLAEDGAGNVRRSQSPVMIRDVPRRPTLRLEVEGSVWE